MKTQPLPIADPPEAVIADATPPSRVLTDEGELTDEEEFYLAQEVAFASLRARYEARPSRKM